jgi:hypothetical protein
VFAFSVCLWQQSTKVETYTLNALLIGLVWLTVSRYDELPSLKRLSVAVFCCGLALTNHLTALCAVAGALIVIVMSFSRSGHSPFVNIFVSLIMGVLPLSLYGLLWINAASHPNGQVWGDPSNWHAFILHITGARYHSYFANQNGYDMAQRDLVNLPATLWHNIGPLLVAVVPGIGRSLWIDSPRRRLALAMLIALSGYFIETTVYGILNIFEYYTPVIMILCIFGSVGCESILQGLKNLKLVGNGPGYKAIGYATLAGTLVVAPIIHWQYCDRSNATFIRDMALNTLNSLPHGAVLIATGDNRVFPMWYAQDVLGIRRDVTVVPRHVFDSLSGTDGITMMSWLVRKLDAQHPEVVNGDQILHRASIDPNYARNEGPTWDIAVEALSKNYPLFMSDPNPQDTHVSNLYYRVLNPIGPNLVLSPYGLVSQIIPERKYANIEIRSKLNTALIIQMKIDQAPDALMMDEPDGNITNHSYSQMLTAISDMQIKSCDLTHAEESMLKAVELNPTADGYHTLGYICFRLNRPLDTVRNYKLALKLDPENDFYRADLKSAQAAFKTFADAPSTYTGVGKAQ